VPNVWLAVAARPSGRAGCAPGRHGPAWRGRSGGTAREAVSVSLAEYRRRLRGSVAQSAAPYGYTLTIWTSGAIVAHVQGVPATVHALVFAAGAILSFMFIGVLAFGRPEQLLRPPKQRDVEVWGAFHLPVVGVAVGLTTLIAHGVDNAVVCWLLVGFLSTSSYLLLIALQFMLAERPNAGR
jgi:hypothetical protein